jgi:putative ABC transport system permease protein
MLKNFLVITFRNFSRHLGYTSLNIAGLTIGLATFIFIALWIHDELSYDQFHKNKATLYQIYHNAQYSDGSIQTYSSTPALLAETLESSIPEVEEAVRTNWGDQLLFTYGKKSFIENGYWADRGFLNIFSYPIIKGNAQDPVPDVYSIAISRTLSEKYFPGEEPLGKVFRVAEKYDFKVTAVFEDVPRNSTMRFDFIIDFDRYFKEREWMKNWGNSSNQTFVKLNEGASAEEVNKKMADVITKNCKECAGIQPILHRYTDIRLHSNYKNGKVDGGRIQYIKGFMFTAIIILLIACINFMNLATARAAMRGREVGVRKVIGAQRKNLIIHFIGESLLITFFSMALALITVQLLLPSFNVLTGKSVGLDLSEPAILLALFSILLFTGILAGSYPAFVLSSFKPVTVLKGQAQSLLSGAGLRKTLVVAQFAISAVLISGSIIVNNQIQYIRTKNLGFNKDNVITMQLRGGVEKHIQAFRNEALKHPGIISMSTAQHNPFSVDNSTTDPIWPGKEDGEQISFRAITSDEHFIPTMGMQLIAGRNFNGARADTVNYIVNEAAVKAMRLDDPVGTPLEMWFGKGQIIGVVKDFHNRNFREKIEPLIFTYYPENSWRIFIRLDGNNIQESISFLQDTYKKFDSVYPFEYSFLDKQFDDVYNAETTTGRLSIAFMVIAIIISCLGLFGLASFTAERRTKEIGVRKVLGASVPNLIMLLCSDFTKLILIALMIGLPFAYYLTSSFLAQYEYHTEMNLWIFVFVALLTLAIAILTVIYQSTKAATINPANTLRND